MIALTLGGESGGARVRRSLMIDPAVFSASAPNEQPERLGQHRKIVQGFQSTQTADVGSTKYIYYNIIVLPGKGTEKDNTSGKAKHTLTMLKLHCK